MSSHKKPAHRKISLKVITALAAIGAVVTAPPILNLNASDHAIDYECGHCGTVLLHAEDDQIHNLTIRCTICGTYNSTNS